MKKFVGLLAVLIISGTVLSGCTADTTAPLVEENYQKEAAALQENQKKISQAVPIPKLDTSLERVNIAKRAEIFNNENKISYIYLVNYGKVMAFYTVKGKVSSLRSYMSPQEILVNADGEKCQRSDEDGSYQDSDNHSCYLVQAPDVDGSYGDNSDGIFFFTTEGAYVEWHGDYMVSDQPLKLSTQPELIREIK